MVAALLVLAVLSAAVAAPWRLESRSWSFFPEMGAPAFTPRPLAPPPASGLPTAPVSNSTNLGWLAPVGIAVLVLLAAALVWWLWRRFRGSRVEGRQAGQPGDVVVLAAEPEVPVLRRGVAAAQRSLDEIGEPNDAIVAAWLALEEAAASSGVRRQPAETPSEFTVDVLRATAADPRATRDLLALYHRARFSAAGVSSTDVRAASHCLAVLAASWSGLTEDAVDRAVRTVAQVPGDASHPNDPGHPNDRGDPGRSSA